MNMYMYNLPFNNAGRLILNAAGDGVLAQNRNLFYSIYSIRSFNN